MTPRQLYENCLIELDALAQLIHQNSQQARDRLMDLKCKWIDLSREYKGTEVEHRLHEALARMPRANTAPGSWMEQIFETRGDLTLALAQTTDVNLRPHLPHKVYYVL
jgi:hypothetical protein